MRTVILAAHTGPVELLDPQEKNEVDVPGYGRAEIAVESLQAPGYGLINASEIRFGVMVAHRPGGVTVTHVSIGDGKTVFQVVTMTPAFHFARTEGFGMAVFPGDLILRHDVNVQVLRSERGVA